MEASAVRLKRKEKGGLLSVEEFVTPFEKGFHNAARSLAVESDRRN